MKHKLGIIGLGFVGTAVSTGFETVMGDAVEIREHDKYKDSESLDTVVNKSNILFICLPTPMDFNTGQCDTSIIFDEIKNINKVAKKKKTIVIKSTVPPGTTDELQSLYPKHAFVFNPEFLREKTFIQDFIDQDRIVVGVTNVSSVDVGELYKDFVIAQNKPTKIILQRAKEAEMVKYVANCFLATKVSFFNEIYEICKAMNIDYDRVVDTATMDSRIGVSHAKVPGHDGYRGFGGSCFPKDLNSLIYIAKELDVDPMMLETVWTKNVIVREHYDWEHLAQVNGKYSKKDE